MSRYLCLIKTIFSITIFLYSTQAFSENFSSVIPEPPTSRGKTKALMILEEDEFILKNFGISKLVEISKQGAQFKDSTNVVLIFDTNGTLYFNPMWGYAKNARDVVDYHGMRPMDYLLNHLDKADTSWFKVVFGNPLDQKKQLNAIALFKRIGNYIIVSGFSDDLI